MSKKVTDIIKSIHNGNKPKQQSQTEQKQQVIVSGASVVQTKAFEKIACAVADMAAGTGGVPTTRSITGVNSIQGGGDLTADRTVQLVGDELNPGTNQYYGTDGTGSKGYHDLPGAGSGTDLGIVGRTDETLNISSSTGADATVPAATEFLAGLMTAQDKTKLDGVETGAEANVQADWNESDISSDAYIKNKPTIPTDTGVVYSLADETPVVVTIGNRGIASAGTDADKEYETSQTIDPLTGNTINQNFANGTVNFDNTEINNTDSTINNENTVTNNDSDSDINNNGNTITNTEVTENYVDSTINNEGTTINNYPGLNLIQCDNIVVGIMPNPTTFAVPVGTDMVKVTLTDVTVYGPDDQTNPGCLPPYELGHTIVNYTPYNLTIGGSVSCTQTFVPGCGYSGTNPVGVVSILWDAITNEIIVLGQLIDGATQLPMYTVDVCFYQFTSDVTITNNTDTTTNNLGDEIVNLAETATITNNFDGDVNNNYSDTYEENNVYQEGATINNEGDVINTYTDYNETNEYTDSEITNNYTNSQVTNEGGVFNYNNTDVNYDENSNVTYEGDLYVGGDIINSYNDMNNGAVALEVGPGVSWTDIANVLSCDGTMAIATPIVPTLLDNVRLVINSVISGDTKSNGVTSGAPAIYGNASDMRGLALTPADVNDADFGAVFKFGDSAYIKVTGFNFAIPVLNTILGVKVNVIFTSTPTSVSVDCITMTIYHTDNTEFTSGVDVYEAGVLKVAAATTIDFNSNAIVTDMGGGVARVDITGGSGGGGAIATEHATQTYNGTDLDWQLPSTPLTEESVHLTTDSGTNLILDVDYSISTDTIIWITFPGTGETISASWIKASGTNITEITEQFLGDGLTDTFTLAQTFLTDAKVYLNGLRQFSTNYAVLGTSLVFSAIPALNDEIVIDYKF